MELREIRTVCTAQGTRGGGGSCPTLYETDNPEVFAIQGYEMEEADRPSTLPNGENIVLIPKSLLEDLK